MKGSPDCPAIRQKQPEETKKPMNDKQNFEEILISTLNNLREDVSGMRQEISNIKTDLAWVKGKLEGRAETRHVVLTAISIFIAICAVVVAIVK